MSIIVTPYGVVDTEKVVANIFKSEKPVGIQKLIPMPPWSGPPLPCGLGIFWPWIKDKDK
jgi:hypothetical protein